MELNGTNGARKKTERSYSIRLERKGGKKMKKESQLYKRIEENNKVIGVIRTNDARTDDKMTNYKRKKEILKKKLES